MYTYPRMYLIKNMFTYIFIHMRPGMFRDKNIYTWICINMYPGVWCVCSVCVCRDIFCEILTDSIRRVSIILCVRRDWSVCAKCVCRNSFKLWNPVGFHLQFILITNIPWYISITNIYVILITNIPIHYLNYKHTNIQWYISIHHLNYKHITHARYNVRSGGWQPLGSQNP